MNSNQEKMVNMQLQSLKRQIFQLNHQSQEYQLSENVNSTQNEMYNTQNIELEQTKLQIGQHSFHIFDLDQDSSNTINDQINDNKNEPVKKTLQIKKQTLSLCTNNKFKNIREKLKGSFISTNSFKTSESYNIDNSNLIDGTITKYQQLKQSKKRVLSDHCQNPFQKKYKLGEQLGEGCASVVKECFALEDNKKYAVKIVRDDDQEKINIAIKEFQLLQKLPFNDNITQVIEYIRDLNRNTIYIVMEYIEGCTLEDYIKKYGQMKEVKAKILMKKLLETIQFLHLNGVCHRDIKPDNVLITNKETLEIKIIDFNVAVQKQKQQEFNLFVKTGVPMWNAPEMQQQNKYNEKIDIWSSGCILYYMLTGSPPFSKFDNDKSILRKQLSQQFLKVLQKVVSSQSLNLLYELFKLNPNERPSAEQALLNQWFFNNKKHFSSNDVLCKNKYLCKYQFSNDYEDSPVLISINYDKNDINSDQSKVVEVDILEDNDFDYDVYEINLNIIQKISKSINDNLKKQSKFQQNENV